jgi:hypothetical protein
MPGLGDAEPPWTPQDRAAIIAEFRRAFPGEQVQIVQPGNLASLWEAMADAARDQDAQRQAIHSWIPPGFAALITAVRRTRLTRFYPFTGHQYLYFADGPGVWDRFWDQGAPACIENGPEGYVILHGAVGYGAPGQRVVRTLTTNDPDEAAAEAERLLEGWAWSGQES